MSVRTIKLPYKTKSQADSDVILSYIKNYNNVLRFTYNRIKDSDSKLSTADITKLQKSMNNVFIDSHFLNSAQFEAKALQDKEKVIFGGRKLFISRCHNKISKEEFDRKRLLPICSIGEANKYGNRKFRIYDENTIIFQPCRQIHIELCLPKLRKNYQKDILKLQELQSKCTLPITYKLGIDYIYISFENNYIHITQEATKIQNRIFSIDLNPNFIGWSVVDWKDSNNYTLIDSGVVSNKILNDKEHNLHKASNSKDHLHIVNKRNFENIDTVIYLINKAIHYQCQIFALEDLSINTSDKGYGRRFNKLCNNQWNRNILYSQIQKRCELHKILFIPVVANYSSFEGNLIYRETGLPDMCLSSIEIGRRGYEFYHQYMVKDKNKQKNIVFNLNEVTKHKIAQSLEELSYFEDFKDIRELYSEIVKTRKMKYRVLLENCNISKVLSKKSIKSQILLYEF